MDSRGVQYPDVPLLTKKQKKCAKKVILQKVRPIHKREIDEVIQGGAAKQVHSATIFIDQGVWLHPLYALISEVTGTAADWRDRDYPFSTAEVLDMCMTSIQDILASQGHSAYLLTDDIIEIYWSKWCWCHWPWPAWWCT